MKFSELIWKPWAMPVAIVVECVSIIGGLWLLFNVLFPGFSLSRPELKTEIRNYTLESAAGQIQVTDLKSGTEFNRILVLPNGRTVVEAGYINSWGEDRIRIIGDRTDP